MKTLAAILFFAFSAWSACTKITYPTDYSTVSSGARANLKANFDAIKTVDDPCKDSVDEVRARFGGYTGSLRMSSLEHLMLRLDTDGSLLGRLGILNGFTGDTLFRVTEDSTWKAWGAGIGTKLTLSDSILAATMRISGLTASRLMATNAGSAAASVSDLTAWVAGTANQITSTSDGDGSITLSIPNGFTLPSASPTFTNLTLSGTLGVTGATTLTPLVGTGTRLVTSTAAGVLGNATTIAGDYMLSGSLYAVGYLATDGYLTFAGFGTTGTGRIYRTAADGLMIRGITGSSNDFSLEAADGNDILRNPAGTTQVIFPASGGVTMASALTLSTLSSGRIPVVSTAGLITQDNLYWDATNDRLGIGSGASSPSYSLDSYRSAVGTGNYLRVGNSDNTSGASHAALVINVAGTNGGDPFIQFSLNGGTEWSSGIDNSDSDAFVISGSGALGTNNRLRIATGGAVTIPGTLGVTGVATFTAQPIMSSLTASLPVFSDGSKGLVSNAMTGTGSVMMSASPTTTGTLTAAAITASGAVSGSTLATSGGEAFTYGDTSFTVTVSNGMTTNPTGTANATRIGRMVFLTLPQITGTGASIAFTITGIPTGWRPASVIEAIPFGFAIDAGVNRYTSDGLSADVNTDGSISLYNSNSVSGWTASGLRQIGFLTNKQTITYSIQ